MNAERASVGEIEASFSNKKSSQCQGSGSSSSSSSRGPLSTTGPPRRADVVHGVQSSIRRKQALKDVSEHRSRSQSPQGSSRAVTQTVALPTTGHLSSLEIIEANQREEDFLRTEARERSYMNSYLLHCFRASGQGTFAQRSTMMQQTELIQRYKLEDERQDYLDDLQKFISQLERGRTQYEQELQQERDELVRTERTERLSLQRQFRKEKPFASLNPEFQSGHEYEISGFMEGTHGQEREESAQLPKWEGRSNSRSSSSPESSSLPFAPHSPTKSIGSPPRSDASSSAGSDILGDFEVEQFSEFMARADTERERRRSRFFSYGGASTKSSASRGSPSTLGRKSVTSRSLASPSSALKRSSVWSFGLGRRQSIAASQRADEEEEDEYEKLPEEEQDDLAKDVNFDPEQHESESRQMLAMEENTNWNRFKFQEITMRSFVVMVDQQESEAAAAKEEETRPGDRVYKAAQLVVEQQKIMDEECNAYLSLLELEEADFLQVEERIGRYANEVDQEVDLGDLLQELTELEALARTAEEARSAVERARREAREASIAKLQVPEDPNQVHPSPRTKLVEWPIFRELQKLELLDEVEARLRLCKSKEQEYRLPYLVESRCLVDRAVFYLMEWRERDSINAQHAAFRSEMLQDQRNVEETELRRAHSILIESLQLQAVEGGQREKSWAMWVETEMELRRAHFIFIQSVQLQAVEERQREVNEGRWAEWVETESGSEDLLRQRNAVEADLSTFHSALIARLHFETLEKWQRLEFEWEWAQWTQFAAGGSQSLFLQRREKELQLLVAHSTCIGCFQLQTLEERQREESEATHERRFIRLQRQFDEEAENIESLKAKRTDWRPRWMFKPRPESHDGEGTAYGGRGPRQPSKKRQSPDDEYYSVDSRELKDSSSAAVGSSRAASRLVGSVVSRSETTSRSSTPFYYDGEGYPHTKDDSAEALMAQNVEKRTAAVKILHKMQHNQRLEVRSSPRSIYSQPVFGALSRYQQQELAIGGNYQEKVAQEASATRHRQQLQVSQNQQKRIEEQKMRDANRIKETSPRLLCRRLPHQQRHSEEVNWTTGHEHLSTEERRLVTTPSPTTQKLQPKKPSESARPGSAKRPQTAGGGGRSSENMVKEPKPISDAKFQERFFTQQVERHQQVETKLHKKYIIDKEKENKQLALEHLGITRKRANKPKEKLTADDVHAKVEQLAIHDVERREKNHEKKLEKAVTRIPKPPGCYVEGRVVNVGELEEFGRKRYSSDIAARMYDASVQRSEKVRESLLSQEEKAFQCRRVHPAPVSKETVDALADRLSQYHVRDLEAAAKEEERLLQERKQSQLQKGQQKEMADRLSAYHGKGFYGDQIAAEQDLLRRLEGQKRALSPKQQKDLCVRLSKVPDTTETPRPVQSPKHRALSPRQQKKLGERLSVSNVKETTEESPTLPGQRIGEHHPVTVSRTEHNRTEDSSTRVLRVAASSKRPATAPKRKERKEKIESEGTVYTTVYAVTRVDFRKM